MDTSDREIDVILQEYDGLRANIGETLRRIDLIRGLYVTVLVGFTAVLMGPHATSIEAQLQQAQQNQLSLSMLLVIPIINATLLIHLTSFMHFILVAAKYNTHQLGGRLSKLIGHNVLGFDLWESPASDKSAWLFTRSIVGIANFALVTFISVAILAQFKEAGRFHRGAIPGTLYCAGIFMIALSVGVAIVHSLVGRRFGDGSGSKKPLHIFRWYALTVPLTVALYVMLQFI